MSTVGRAIRQLDILYALCQMPVQCSLTIVTSTQRALLGFRAAPAVKRTRLACQKHCCQAYNLWTVFVEQVSLVTAINVAASPAPQFQSRVVVRSGRTGWSFSNLQFSGAGMSAKFGTIRRNS